MRPLSARMGALWGAMAATGSPNGGGGGGGDGDGGGPNPGRPSWPRYNVESDTNLLVSEGGSIVAEAGYRKKYCDFWASVRDV